MNTTGGMIKKNYSTYIILAILVAVVSFVGNVYIGFILAAALYISFCWLTLADGLDRGERACTTTANTDKMISEGLSVDPKLMVQRFDKKKAVKAYLWSTIPLALLAAANVFFPDAHVPGVDFLTLDFICRIVFFPFMGFIRLMVSLVKVDMSGIVNISKAFIANVPVTADGFKTVADSMGSIASFAFKYDFQYLDIMRVCFVPFTFILPLFMMIGYMQGPSERAKKLKAIAKGARKKRKNLKVNKAPKGPKQAKPMI